MIDVKQEIAEQLLDRTALGTASRSGLVEMSKTLGVAGAIDPQLAEGAVTAGEIQSENRESLKAAYDYIVVGAGAAGCVIAARLAEAGADVLLIESGGTDDLPQVATPGLWFTNLGGPLDWNFTAQPSAAVAGRRVPMAMGRVLGGGTSINAMQWVRGLASDFDGWVAEGCDGWSFAEILPTYRALEDWEGGANEWRGSGGPLSVITPKSPHPTAPIFIEAAREMGVPVRDDLNGPMREGAGYMNLTITRQGARASAARAFLRPALVRPNLTLLLEADVTRLQIDGSRCNGITLQQGTATRDIKATKEVILCAGGMFSAKLLMLSGIGNAEELRRAGVAPVTNLRGVGRNFQDHPLLFGVVSTYRGKMPAHAMECNAGEAIAYVRSDTGIADPDIAMVLTQLPIVTPEIQAQYGAPPPDCFTISPALIRPTSRGKLTLSSADWREPARLDAGFLTTEQDLDRTVRCIEMCRELGSQKAFDAIREREIVPGRTLNKAELQAFARNAAISFGHPVGTCRMGKDDDAVVDPELRVHGIIGLRVCDSSVMPTIITGPTQAPSMLIGARAADLILAAV